MNASNTDSKTIPFNPLVPEEIKDAARHGKLVIFVGAGVSCLAGSPNWDDFANGMLRQAMSKEALNHAELDQIKHLSPKIKLFIAREACSLSSDDYKRILEPNRPIKENGVELYRDIQSISKTIVTTNYDGWLDNPLPPKTLGVSAPRLEKMVYYKPEDINVDKLKPGAVIHLHGSTQEPLSMILTTGDYVRHYKSEVNDKGKQLNPILVFLKHLFAERNVLFIGYGLKELEILDYILLKKETPEDDPRRITRHFILQGFYSHQTDLTKHLSHYFQEECSVKLIRFNMEKKGYGALADVLSKWAEDIVLGDLPPLDERLEAERWLDE